MKQLRILLYGEESIPSNISVRNYLPNESKHKVYSIQYSAETMLKISLGLMNILTITAIILDWSIFCKFNKILILAVLVLLIALEIIIIWKGVKKVKNT
jgi:hypothetical protein